MGYELKRSAHPPLELLAEPEAVLVLEALDADADEADEDDVADDEPVDVLEDVFMPHDPDETDDDVMNEPVVEAPTEVDDGQLASPHVPRDGAAANSPVWHRPPGPQSASAQQ